MGAMSPHFKESELVCPCCRVNGMQSSGLDLAEDIRSMAEQRYGMGRVQVAVDSAYRCETHNAAVGGAKHSQHVLGIALDIRLLIGQDRGKGKVEWVALAPYEMEELARKSALLGGIGRDDERGFVHVDARSKTMALPAQWCYKGGKEVAYYKPSTGVSNVVS